MSCSLVSFDGPRCAARRPARDRRGAALIGFSLVALNPAFAATWAGFAAIASASGALTDLRASALPVALGAFGGIVLWFELVRRVAGAREAPLPARASLLLSRALGVALLGFASWLAAALLLNL